MQYWNFLLRLLTITVLICTGQISLIRSAPRPFISTFLQPPPARPIRILPYYEYNDHSHTTFRKPEGKNKAKPELTETDHPFDSFESHPYDDEDEHHHNEQPPAGFSHISKTETNHPKSSPPSHSENHGHHYHHHGTHNDDTFTNFPSKKNLQIFLFTPLSTKQLQTLLLNQLSNNKKYHYEDAESREEQDFHQPKQELYRPHHNGEEEYNYLNQLRPGQKNPKYGTHRDSKLSLGFDANNNNYAPSMIYKNYEVRLPKTRYAVNSTDIPTFMYAPNMSYGYYGVG